MMKTYNESVKINHNLNWHFIPDHPYMSLIIGSSGSRKTNVWFNLVKKPQPEIEKIYLYIKDPFKWKYQLIKKVAIKKLKNPKAFIDFSQTNDDACEIFEGYNSTKKRKMLILFDDMITDTESNKKLILFWLELFLIEGKLTILLQSPKIYKAKCSTLFYKIEQNRTSANSINSFVWNWF